MTCSRLYYFEPKETDMTIRKDYIAKGLIQPGKGKLNAAELNALGYFAAAEGVANRGIRAAIREGK